MLKVLLRNGVSLLNKHLLMAFRSEASTESSMHKGLIAMPGWKKQALVMEVDYQSDTARKGAKMREAKWCQKGKKRMGVGTKEPRRQVDARHEKILAIFP